MIRPDSHVDTHCSATLILRDKVFTGVWISQEEKMGRPYPYRAGGCCRVHSLPHLQNFVLWSGYNRGTRLERYWLDWPRLLRTNWRYFPPYLHRSLRADASTVVDQPRFHIAFEQSVLNSIETNLTLKLKANGSSTMGYQTTSPKDTIFDMKFYPHGTTEDVAETKCIFAMAVPYPSRNTTMWAWMDAKFSLAYFFLQVKYYAGTQSRERTTTADGWWDAKPRSRRSPYIPTSSVQFYVCDIFFESSNTCSSPTPRNERALCSSPSILCFNIWCIQRGAKYIHRYFGVRQRGCL